MPTANEQLQSALLKRQSYLQLLARRLGIDFKDLLDGTHREIKGLIVDEIPKITSGLNTKATAGRYAKISNEYQKIRKPVYDKFEAEYTLTMAKLANDEAEFIAKTMQNSIPFDLTLISPSNTSIHNLTAFAPYNGRTISQWFTAISAGDFQRFEGTVRASVNQGLTLDNIINLVIGNYYKSTDKYTGTVQSSRNGAETLVRTITNGVSNGARQEFYQSNSDIIDYEVYTATLDGRTSIICASLDGQKLKVGEGEVPPLHPNCRSTRIPVIDQFGLLGSRPSVGGTDFREEARKDYINKKMNSGTSRKEAQSLWNNTSNEFKNRKLNEARRNFGKNVIGAEPPNTTYGSWLKKQDSDFQNTVLGKTNAEKFRSGEMTLDKFTDRLGKPLSLAELRAKYPEVYKE